MGRREDGTIRYVVYERVNETPTGQRPLPGWCYFFLVDEPMGEVYVTANVVSEFAQFVFFCSGELIVYPRDGSIREIRGRKFVSARAVAEDDPRFEELRVNILESFRACETVVDSFD